MEPPESAPEAQEVSEDELTVPTGPWEEDDSEDCPAYHTAAFRMYVMKILPCFKRYCHDWTICPFAHPGEKARRRDPRTAHYAGIACPEMKKAGSCRRGNSCPYAHTVFEYWLHPNRYRTQLCKDGTSCQRRVCFFAHSLSELRSSGSRSSTQEGIAGSVQNEEEVDISGFGLFSAAQDQAGSPKSDASPFEVPTTDTSASTSLKPGLPDSVSGESTRSLSLSSESTSLSKAAASIGAQGRETDRVSVSEVNDAVVSLKAAMMEGTADRAQVIDMLSSLLRGSPSMAEGAGGSLPDTHRYDPASLLPEMAQQRSASNPQPAQQQKAQQQQQLPPAPANARRQGTAEATPRHRKSRHAQSQAQSMHSYSAAQGRLPPHVQAAMGTANHQRKGSAASREREGPQLPLQQAAASKAGLQGDAKTRATLRDTALAIQQLQASQAGQLGTSPQSHGLASGPASLSQTPERQTSGGSSRPPRGTPSLGGQLSPQHNRTGSGPDLAAQARETLYAMEQQQRLPVFPESEDSGELSERMRLLSMAHSQNADALLRQQYGLQMPQRSAPLQGLGGGSLHPFLVSGSSSVPLPPASRQEHQPASSFSSQQHAAEPVYDPAASYSAQHYPFAGQPPHPATLSGHGRSVGGSHRLEQVSSAPVYPSAAGLGRSSDMLLNSLLMAGVGPHEGAPGGAGSYMQGQHLPELRDPVMLQDYEANLTRSLSSDQGGLQGGYGNFRDSSRADLYGHLAPSSGLYSGYKPGTGLSEASMSFAASAAGSPSGMYDVAFHNRQGQPNSMPVQGSESLSYPALFHQ